MTNASLLSIGNKKPIIALDCDGVLLDYQTTFPQIYRKVFGKQLTLVSPKSYRATTRYGVTFTPEEKSQFNAAWDVDGWRTMSMHDGALEACHLLDAAGYELVCVTALRACFIEHRLENFRLHGFPIDRIISTRRDIESSDNNPKKQAIEQLHPIVFVDDKKRNFQDIEGVQTKFVFIDHELENDPHRDANIHYNAKYPSLLAFVKDFLKDDIIWLNKSDCLVSLT
ncbi:unnamed protein product [Rotaria sordida]|uniref:Uncharacterized protein n=2 Tax=Rotaria sordida TaxID=392033 RepID=A0A815A1R4_9BILA|nr:unnamed protein product [Rotaria sordida]CAF1249412.1 unnamed protein product [Rotaria sordida]CAF1530354.1 unnamed protein product [Rotaria sordida]CAF1531095.1 unnamed protein product [Rotaria sordida]CAF3727240.1 unnamed protein product [Rotaria sordida]